MDVTKVVEIFFNSSLIIIGIIVAVYSLILTKREEMLDRTARGVVVARSLSSQLNVKLQYINDLGIYFRGGFITMIASFSLVTILSFFMLSFYEKIYSTSFLYISAALIFFIGIISFLINMIQILLDLRRLNEEYLRKKIREYTPEYSKGFKKKK